jgi:2-haloacid dehalogenase
MAQRPIIDNTLEISGRRASWRSIRADPCLIASHVREKRAPSRPAGCRPQPVLSLREGNAPLDVGPPPNYIGKDRDAIVNQLPERYPSSPMA